MKNFTYLFALLSLFVFFSCDDDDGNAPTTNTEEFSVENKVYRISSITLNEPVDIDGDGVYSTTILEELACTGIGGYSIAFNQEKILHPAYTGYALKVETDANGNPVQVFSCGFLDGILPFWQQNGNTIIFYYDTWESPSIIGELSEDGQQITFNATWDSGAIFLRQILRAGNRY